MTKTTIQRISSLLTIIVVAVIAFLSLATLNGQAQVAEATRSLAPIPAGLPGYFGYGLFNASMSDMHSSVPYNYRYQYLAGGVTGGGWRGWQGDGRYAASYVSASRQVGYIPGFVYYNILQSSPSYDEYGNLQNASTMLAYYQDFKILLQQCAGGGAVFINVEPDLDGVMMQHSSNTDDDASGQPAKAGGSGMSELSGIPDNFRGYWQALARLRDLYAPNVILGQDLSIWGADYDLTIALRNDPNFNWQAHADRTAAYHMSFGPGYDLNFFSPLDRDAAFYQITYGSNRWWDDTDTREPRFSTFGAWLNRINSTMDKRALLWQVPNGNRVYRSENNTSGHYQDNRPEYFLNPTSGRAHMQQWANYGVMGIMFGAGVGSQSHYFDSNRDGVTNPAPINGNDLVAQYADDDGGYIRTQVSAYYSGGTIPLPGGGASSPTATRSSTGQPTNIRTHTRTATGAPINTATFTSVRTSTPGPSTTRTPTPVRSNTPASTPPPAGNLPWLKTLNGQIVRADNNQRVELRGVNLLRYEWVQNMNFERLAIPHLANVWHANLILHGFASAPVVAGDAAYLAALDEYQQLAEQNNMYIIFAYYYPTINGDQPPHPDVDSNSQEALVRLVQRYRNKSNVMFMLQAEPHSDTWNGEYHRVTWNTLRPTYDRMITAMRAVDNPSPSKHLILASGDGWGRDISPVVVDEYGVGYVDPIRADGAENIVYSSHPYDTAGSTNDWDYFLPVADAGYPVLVTEFGTGGQMSQADTDRLLMLMNSGNRHIGWTAWIFDSEGCPCLLTGTRTSFTPSSPYGLSIRDRVIAEATDFGSGPGPTGTPTRTFTRVASSTTTPIGTATRTSTPNGSSMLVGHVNWQGRAPQPSSQQIAPITLTLKSAGGEVNYPVQNTDSSGFFTVSVSDLPNGTYNWRVKGPKFLANAGSLTLGSGQNSLEAGLMISGDCNNDNTVSMLDFNILKLSMGRAFGETAYDDRADLTGNRMVNSLDFTLFLLNRGESGAPPITP